jgi:hypothetical protein
MSNNERSNSEQSEKCRQIYTTPKLIVLGDFAKITKGSISGPNEDLTTTRQNDTFS